MKEDFWSGILLVVFFCCMFWGAFLRLGRRLEETRLSLEVYDKMREYERNGDEFAAAKCRETLEKVKFLEKQGVEK